MPRLRYAAAMPPRPSGSTPRAFLSALACAAPVSFALVSFGLPKVAAAQAFERSGGATERALAGASAATGADPTALWGNPANLAGATRRLAFGLALTADSSSYRAEQPPEQRAVDGPLLAPQLALVLPLSRRFHLAFGYRWTWRQALRFTPSAEERTPGAAQDCAVHPPGLRFLGREHRSGEQVFGFGAAYQRGALALGASFELGLARLRGRRELFAGSRGDLTDLESICHDLGARFELSGLALGGRAGAVLAPAWWLAFGLWISPPRVMSLSGPLTLAAPTSPPSGYRRAMPQDGQAEVMLTLPAEMALGLRFHLGRDLLLHGEVGLRLARDASRLRSAATLQLEDVAGGRTAPVPIALPLLPTGTIAPRTQLGLEWRLLDEAVVLRGGWGYEASTFDGPPLDSLMIDLDRHRLGLGVTLTRGRLSVSLTLAHTFERSLPLATQLPVNPVDPQATRPALPGALRVSRTHVLAEVQVGW